MSLRSGCRSRMCAFPANKSIRQPSRAQIDVGVYIRDGVLALIYVRAAFVARVRGTLSSPHVWRAFLVHGSTRLNYPDDEPKNFPTVPNFTTMELS